MKRRAASAKVLESPAYRRRIVPDKRRKESAALAAKEIKAEKHR